MSSSDNYLVQLERNLQRENKRVMQRKQDTFDLIMKVLIFIIVFCVLALLITAGAKKYSETHYTVVTVEGKSYSSDDHEIYIDPEERFVTIDGTRYSWVYVNSVAYKVREEK